MKHRGSFPHRMDARDRHNGQKRQTNERTDGRTDGRPSLRWRLTLNLEIKNNSRKWGFYGIESSWCKLRPTFLTFAIFTKFTIQQYTLLDFRFALRNLSLPNSFIIRRWSTSSEKPSNTTLRRCYSCSTQNDLWLPTNCTTRLHIASINSVYYHDSQ